MPTLFEFLQSSSKNSVNQDKLKSIASEAVRDYVSNNIPLNTTIGKLVKEASLNRDQLNRVVEFANNETFLTLFRNKEKTAANVNFTVADAEAIDKYIHAEPVAKTASLNLSDIELKKEDVTTEEIFFIKEKKAEIMNNPLPTRDEYYELLDRLSQDKSDAHIASSVFGMKLTEIAKEIQKEFGSTVDMSQNEKADISEFIIKTAEDKNLAAVLLESLQLSTKDIPEVLSSKEIDTTNKLCEDISELKKLAHVILDLNSDILYLKDLNNKVITGVRNAINKNCTN